MAERKQAMSQLLRLLRFSQVDVMSQHFKTILLLLLETLADVNVRYGDDTFASFTSFWHQLLAQNCTRSVGDWYQ